MSASNSQGARAPNLVEQLRNPELAAQAAKQTVRTVGGATAKAFFDAQRDSIGRVLPKGVTPDRILAMAMLAMRENPKLQECTLKSLFGAVIQCAKLGLEPNNGLGHCFILPFNATKKRQVDGRWLEEKTVEAQFILGYQGMLELIRRSKAVGRVWTRVVYENDHFRALQGTEERYEHEPLFRGDRGEAVGVYACAELMGVITTDGKPAIQPEYMTMAEVRRIRDLSPGFQAAIRAAEKFKRALRPSDSPWVAHEDEMARKTVLRRLFKWLPRSAEMELAMALDEAAGHRSQRLDEVLDGQEVSAYAVQEDEEDDSAQQDPAPAADPAPAPPAAIEHAQTVNLEIKVAAPEEPVEVQNASPEELAALSKGTLGEGDLLGGEAGPTKRRGGR